MNNSKIYFLKMEVIDILNIILFIIIFGVLLFLNYNFVKRDYIHNFLTNYKIDREKFFKQIIDKSHEENPIYTIDVKEFENKTIEAENYLKDAGVESKKYFINIDGVNKRMDLLKNLGYVHFNDDGNANPTIEMYHLGQRMIQQAIIHYKLPDFLLFTPFYWLFKNNKNKRSVQKSVITTLALFIISTLFTIILNILSNYIYDMLFIILKII